MNQNAVRFICQTIVLLVASFSASISKADTATSLELWYNTPAANWIEALPVGNGRMGAMVFGGVPNERIQFNEQTLWTGINATQHLFGHNQGDGAMGDYNPFGDLTLRFPITHSQSTDYRRNLDLRTAIATTRYRAGAITFTREVFASHPDRVVVVRLTADKSASLSFQIALKDVKRRQREPVATTASATDRQLSFGGRFSRPDNAPPGDLRWNNLAYHAAVRVLAEGGEVTAQNDELTVTNADAVTLLLSAATDYDPSPRKGFRGDAPAPIVAANLDDVSRKSYAQIRADHVSDHQRLFCRVSLDLGDHDRNTLPTDQRLIQYKTGASDRALEALLFQFGRYLAIASARPGGLPANLQGIWNENPSPAWYCGYTHNINVQMNNWLAETTNLPECAEPLFDWIENIALGTQLNPDPKLKTELGWIMYSTHNPMGGNSGWAVHKPGSAWLSQHFWEHFAFGGDREFLRTRAYPQLRELTRMWDARLVEGPNGKLLIPDGWSPEHTPIRGADGRTIIKEGDRSALPGVSYDQQIVWDLFSNFIDASEQLGLDEDLRDRIVERRDKLLGPQVGRWGQLQEWMEDVDDPKLDYRHLSHLFALHPGRQISPLTTPEWAAAAKVTLDARSDNSVGWSRAWKICFRARLLNGNTAAKAVRATLQHVPANTKGSGTYPNLFGAGPPFQADANFGYTAGLSEMLLQSHLHDNTGYILHILPALPDAWPAGEIAGLRARGGFQVSIQWRDGKLARATIKSLLGNSCSVRVKEECRVLHLRKGESYDWMP